jgi:hypothetical protein
LIEIRLRQLSASSVRAMPAPIRRNAWCGLRIAIRPTYSPRVGSPILSAPRASGRDLLQTAGVGLFDACRGAVTGRGRPKILGIWERSVTERSAQYNLAMPGSLANRVAARVRTRMFAAFIREFAPLSSETILDVGVTSDQSYTSSNYLEALYPHKNRITAAGIQDASFLETEYPGMTFVFANALDLPFSDGSFDWCIPPRCWSMWDRSETSRR